MSRRLFPLLSTYRYHIGAVSGVISGTIITLCVTRKTPTEDATYIALESAFVFAVCGLCVAAYPVLIGGTLLGVATYSLCFAAVHQMTKRKD